MWNGQTQLKEAWRSSFRTRRVIIWALLLGLYAGVLTFLPLFNVLGYEFSLALTLPISIAAIDVTTTWIFRARKVRRSPANQIASPALITSSLTFSSLLLGGSMLLLPLAVVSANALRSQNCDWLFGFLTYAALPGMTCLLSVVLALFASVAFPSKRWLASLVCYALLGFSAFASILRFYNAPAVFSYNPIIGYFPGSLYDESIALEAPFYWARGLHTLVALAGVFAIAMLLDSATLRLSRHRCPKGWRIWSALSSALALAAALIIWINAGRLGFIVTSEDVDEALPGVYVSEHFVIRYPRGAAIERDIGLIAEDHEFRLAQVVQTLGAKPSRKITSYLFDSPSTKHALMGAKDVYMAKPWRSEIYINAAQFPHPVLRHEIAHVVAGEFGSPLFRVSASGLFGLPLKFNVGLIEGIAVAADWPDHFNKELTPHQSIKALIELDQLPPVKKLMSTGFFAFSSARSYTVAGSFTRYLLDRFGAELLQVAYQSGGNLQQAFGESEQSLIRDWYAMVSSIELPPGAAEIVRERFRRESILNRPCAHAIARDREEIGVLESKGRFHKAIKIADGMCRAVPREPTYALERSRLQIKAGLNQRALSELRILADRKETLSSAIRAGALLTMAEIHVRDAHPEIATALLIEAAKLPLGDDHARLVEVSLDVLGHSGPARRELLLYLWGGRPELQASPALRLARAAEAARLEDASGLAHYLVARQIQERGDPGATTDALVRAFDRGLSDRLSLEAATMLAASAYKAGRIKALRFAIAILAKETQSKVTRLYAADWLERLEWKQKGELSAVHKR